VQGVAVQRDCSAKALQRGAVAPDQAQVRSHDSSLIGLRVRQRRRLQGYGEFMSDLSLSGKGFMKHFYTDLFWSLIVTINSVLV
jgi:hypothetical protein